MRQWDTKVRLQAFEWLDEMVAIHDEILPRLLLQQGFELEGRRIPLVAPNGIFTPRNCDYPLSITTVFQGPYTDKFEDAHRLAYRYRGEDPQHRDNVGLRNAMRDNVPLIYFYAVTKGRYLAIKPIFVTGDNPAELTFTVMADVAGTFENKQQSAFAIADHKQAELRREYATFAAQHRVHQKAFRERVIDAYRTHCAMCRLKHRELLDAAHIIPDSNPEGHPEVSKETLINACRTSEFERFA